MKSTKLAPKLEHELLAAVVRGACSPTIVDPKELSKVGRIVHAAITQLAKNGVNAPFNLATVYTHSVSNLGSPDGDTRDFLRTVQEAYKSKEQTVLLKIAKEKETLVNIFNEASKQLGSGNVEFNKFETLLQQKQDLGEKPKSLAELHENYEGEPDNGFMVDSLPTISECTKGLQGVWIIGGEPGVGKSTLGLQLAMEVQRALPVMYYDIDGTGESWMCYRVAQAVGKENFNAATQNLYYRNSISSLDSDVVCLSSPVLLVVDSIQTLPLHILHRRSTLDEWMTRFKVLANKGFLVLLISELNRNAYGEIRMGAYKESGGIEYAGSMCAQLHETQEGSGLLEFHIVKNRHGPRKGHVATLARNEERPFWLEEV